MVPGRNSRYVHKGVRNVKVMSHHWGYLVSNNIYKKVRDALLE